MSDLPMTAFKQPSMTSYRIYADGTVLHEQDFDEKDNELPYYDDYELIYVPDVIVGHIEDSTLGK